MEMKKVSNRSPPGRGTNRRILKLKGLVKRKHGGLRCPQESLAFLPCYGTICFRIQPTALGYFGFRKTK